MRARAGALLPVPLDQVDDLLLRMEVGLFQYAADVGAHGALGHEEGLGDHLGGAAAGQEGQHLGLAAGEAVVFDDGGVEGLLGIVGGRRGRGFGCGG